MTKIKRFMTFLVSVIMVIQCASFITYAEVESLEEITDVEESLSQQASLTDAYAVEEVQERRETDIKHFKMSDGSFTAVKYSEPVHFVQNGKLVDIDNTLVQQSAVAVNPGYTNSNAEISVVFAPDVTNDDLVSLSIGEYTVKLGYVQNVTAVSAFGTYSSLYPRSVFVPLTQRLDDPKINSLIDDISTVSNILYTNIEPDVDLEYVLSGGSVKENIIVKNEKSSYVYKFNLDAGGLVARENSDGSIGYFDGDEEIFFTPAPIMYDADGNYSELVDISIENWGNNYQLTVTANADWINSEERSFPVTIDPEMSAESNRGYDATFATQEVRSDMPDDVFGQDSTTFEVRADIHSIRRTYFDTELPALKKGDVICNAQIFFYADTQCSTDNYNRINMHWLSETFSADTLCWNNQPAYDSAVLDYYVLEASSTLEENDDDLYLFDITRTIKEMYNGTRANNGFVLKFDDETRGNYTRRIVAQNGDYDENRAKLIVNYRNTAGFEDY